MLVKMCCTLLYIDVPFFPLAKHENLACPLALNEVCGENEDSLIFAFNKSVRKQCPCPNVWGCYVLTKQNPGWHQVSSRCTVHLCTFVFRSSSSTSWRLRQNDILPTQKPKYLKWSRKARDLDEFQTLSCQPQSQKFKPSRQPNTTQILGWKQNPLLPTKISKHRPFFGLC